MPLCVTGPGAHVPLPALYQYVWAGWEGWRKRARDSAGRAAGSTWLALLCPLRTLEPLPQETTWSAPRPPETWRRSLPGHHLPSWLGGAQIPGSPDPPGSSVLAEGRGK